MLGVWYPKDYIVAAIDAADGAAAVEELLAAGFGTDAVHLHDSARVLQNAATIYDQRFALQRAGAALTGAVTDEGLLSQEYLEEATRGPRSSRCVLRAAAGGGGPPDSRRARGAAHAVLRGQVDRRADVAPLRTLQPTRGDMRCSMPRKPFATSHPP